MKRINLPDSCEFFLDRTPAKYDKWSFELQINHIKSTNICGLPIKKTAKLFEQQQQRFFFFYLWDSFWATWKTTYSWNSNWTLWVDCSRRLVFFLKKIIIVKYFILWQKETYSIARAQCALWMASEKGHNACTMFVCAFNWSFAFSNLSAASWSMCNAPSLVLSARTHTYRTFEIAEININASQRNTISKINNRKQ